MPAPTRSAYPIPEEVQAFIEGAGLTVSSALEALLESAAAAAATDFEAAADRQMLASSTASLRYFDPPVNRDGLLFLDDMAAAPTLVQSVPFGGSAETLTIGTDYLLEPANVLAKYRPYTQIRFRRRWQSPVPVSLLQSLQITARWGYGTALPDDVWQAVCMRAAWNVWQQVTFGNTGGVLGWKDGDRSVDYGIERWTAPVKLWCGDDGTGGAYGQVVARYRRLFI